MTVECGKYRSRPVEIEAFHWLGQPPSEWPAWARDHLSIRYEITCLQIDTIDGTMRVNQGDWVIKGTIGEVYPCKDRVFRGKYDKID